jgi:hypothetical protein
MTLTFNHRAMITALQAFARAAGCYLTAPSRQRLDRLAMRLHQAVENGSEQFTWSTDENGSPAPIETIMSNRWKGSEGSSYRGLMASQTWKWVCCVDSRRPGRLVVDEGAIVVQICGEDPSRSKVLHFDVCTGGTDGQAGHPVFHMQFYGMINDVPRLPTYVLHPVDVLELIILELFQERWRRHVQLAETKSKLRGHAAQQKARIATALKMWLDIISAGTGDHSFVSMQKRGVAPLLLD